ncbi:succinyl-diaminopimelate desuccinylase [Breoghania sp. L-A4]|uniref:succinyl-diaminopimelate desuccinylase n=1 Tax=Breoghania sp. L-A4 TaxID=2304600 RepID=UPI000E35D3A3|nr:succinyl-diaminopimelate desuccinylase [Breoghania sp. L-A4]AXS39117.1 succinyl-diaminopimelate desuccinylase [Breoghania sp. L-A4]
MTRDTDLSPPVRIARDLVRCPSVTPAEGGALAHLEALLAQAGFAVHRVVFSEPGTPDVENLFAKFGSGHPHVAFAGHTDVVPAGDPASWSHEPFAGEIIDGVLYGRGTVDMKGGVAAFAAAAIDFARTAGDAFSGAISFLITGDEEGPAVNGTVKLMQWCAERGEVFDACIVGEPTNPEALGDAIKVGRRGSLSGTLTVTGVQGHVAYPHLAKNPVPGMLSLLGALEALHLDDGNDRFEPSNLEIVSVDVGNPAFNVTPERIEARFNIRFNDVWTRETLMHRLRETLAAAAASLGDLDYELAFRADGSDSFLTSDAELIAALSDAVEAETGRRPALSTGGGTSDARFIKDYCPVVEFGLVGKTMHKVDECVEIKDLDRLAAIYARYLARVFAA